MSAEMRSIQRFPTPCTRCGGVLYQTVAFCPYCGISQPLGGGQPRRAEAQLRAVVKEGPRAPVPVDDDDEPTSPEIRWSDMAAAPAVARQPFWRWPLQRLVTGGVVVLVVMLMLGYLAFLRFGAGHQDERVVERTTTGLNSTDVASTSGMPPNPDNAAMNAAAQARATTTPTAAGTSAGSAAQYSRGVSVALDDARTSLAHKNLTAAKAAIAEVLAVAPNNAAALQMQRDIADRENERNVALSVASTCAKDMLWNCVLKQASLAVAADSSSRDAQVLLERAIVSTGWRPLAVNAAPPARRDPPPRVVAKSAPAVPMLPTLPSLPPLPPGVPATSASRAPIDNVARNAQPVSDYAPVAGDGVDAGTRAVGQ